jgi:hypothetical protein
MMPREFISAHAETNASSDAFNVKNPYINEENKKPQEESISKPS